MSPSALSGLLDAREIVEALPVGLAIYDEHLRLVLMNAAVHRALGAGIAPFRPGSGLAGHVRVAAARGWFGPGDPEAQGRAVMALDFSRPHRFRRRHPDGRTFETHYTPLASGGIALCLFDITAVDTLRQEADRAIARIRTALGSLRIGLALLGPDGALVFGNRQFAAHLGLPEAALSPGIAYPALQALMATDGAFEPSPLTGAFPPVSFRRARRDGRVIDATADPLPDGGWCLTVADITPAVRSEDEARRRAGLLDDILHHLPHGVMVYDAEGRVALVNEAYNRLMRGAEARLGDTEAELVRRRVESGEYGQEDGGQRAARRLALDLSGPVLRRHQRPGGATIEARSTPLPGGGRIVVLDDVTSLVEAQAARAQEADLLASVVAHIPHGISLFGPDRRLRLVNDAYTRIMDGAPVHLGERLEAITERRVRSGEYGDTGRDLGALPEAAATAGPRAHRRVRPNGTVIEVRTAPMPDGGELNVVTDVTTLAAAESHRVRSADEMHAMLSHIGHGVVLWGADGRVVAANAIAAELLGADPALLVPGRTLEEVVASALDRGNLGEGAAGLARARRLMEQDRTQPHHDQRLTRDGRVLAVRSDPIPGGGFVTTYSDMTLHHEAEDALRLAKTAAEAANAAKSRFLAAMGTELRAPLTTIQAALGGLTRAAGRGTRGAQQNGARQNGARQNGAGQTGSGQVGAGHEGAGRAGAGQASGGHRGGLDPDQVAQACETSLDAARNLLGLIDSILDVARLEAGRFDLVETVVELPMLVRACLRRNDSAAAAAEVALVAEMPEALPAIRCDERRIQQALANLVGNAIRFSNPLGSVAIGARQEWSTGDLLVTVQDTGDGIPAPELERMFEPFGHVEPGRPGGAGLGLYVARTLLRAHGGDLALRSEPGQGTTATVRLPASRVIQPG